MVALVPLDLPPACFLWLVRVSQCQLLDNIQLKPLLQGFRFPEMLHIVIYIYGRYAASTVARSPPLRHKRVVRTSFQQLLAPSLFLVKNSMPSHFGYSPTLSDECACRGQISVVLVLIALALHSLVAKDSSVSLSSDP